MLKLNDHPALRLHVGDVLFTILRELDSLLPVCRKFILPSSMPFCFRLPPRITDANTSVRPVPYSVIAALGNHGSPARWAYSGKPRFSFATLAFDVCELHSLACPQPQSGAIVTANRGAWQARLMSVTCQSRAKRSTFAMSGIRPAAAPTAPRQCSRSAGILACPLASLHYRPQWRRSARFPARQGRRRNAVTITSAATACSAAVMPSAQL